MKHSYLDESSNLMPNKPKMTPAVRSMANFVLMYASLGLDAESANATTKYQDASRAKTPTGKAAVRGKDGDGGDIAANMTPY